MMFHVKPNSTQKMSADARLMDLLGRVGCRPDQVQLAALLHHLDLVLEHNKIVNLTRITDYDAALRLHVVDSLAWLSLLPEPEQPIVDIGSGAGYPGLPLAITLSARVVLCESVQKKSQFLVAAAADVAPDVSVYPGRAEALALERPGLAGTVTARAVSSLASLVELAAPLLGDGGRLIALKARLPSEELEQGIAASSLCGMRCTETIAYTLPDGAEQRTVVEFTRVGRPSVELPRRPGLAQRMPLGSAK